MAGFRKAAKVPYPYEYASYEQIQTASPERAKAMDQFNRAQRGHQNYGENHTLAVGSMLITGLQYPRAAAILGGLWSSGRVLYAIGYTDGKADGKGRYLGGFGIIAHYVLLIWSGVSAYNFVMGKA